MTVPLKEAVEAARRIRDMEPDQFEHVPVLFQRAQRVAAALLALSSPPPDVGDLVERLRYASAQHRASIAEWKDRGEIGRRYEQIMTRKAGLLDEAADTLTRLSSAGEAERRRTIEECIQRLDAHWKSCMGRGDRRGDDMAYGINLGIESLRSLSSRGVGDGEGMK